MIPYVEKNLPDVAQRVNYIVQFRNMKVRYKKSLHIIAKALSYVREDVRPEDLSTEWIIDFLDYSRKVFSDSNQISGLKSVHTSLTIPVPFLESSL
mgnify:CR=1 FL=1